MLSPVRTFPPATTPVSLAEAKVQLGVDHSDHDDLIESLIEAATAHLDGYSGVLGGRALITQTWRLDLGCWGYPIRLPIAPVQSIQSIRYWDASNVEAQLAGSVYHLLTDALGPHVALQPDQSWPAHYSRADAVSVTIVAGYGAATDVPAPLRTAIKMMVTHWYENRGVASVGAVASEIPLGVNSLISPYKRWSV